MCGDCYLFLQLHSIIPSVNEGHVGQLRSPVLVFDVGGQGWQTIREVLFKSVLSIKNTEYSVTVTYHPKRKHMTY